MATTADSGSEYRFEAEFDLPVNSWKVTAFLVATDEVVLYFWTTTLDNIETTYLSFIATAEAKAYYDALPAPI